MYINTDTISTTFHTMSAPSKLPVYALIPHQKKGGKKCRCLFPVLWSACDVCHSVWEALETKKGNEALLGVCRKRSVVTKSGVKGGSGPAERGDQEVFMGCLKYYREITGQLKFNTSAARCQQACHLGRIYWCVRRVYFTAGYDWRHSGKE